MLFRAFKKPGALAEICRNIAEVLFALVFIGSIFEKDGILWVGLLGLIFSIILWGISLFLERE